MLLMAGVWCLPARCTGGESFDILRRAAITGVCSDYHGFACTTFRFEGREAKVVVPHHTAPGHPWIWRARFWGHEPQTEVALLARGFHLVYCDVAELFGNAEALGIWNRFYTKLVYGGLSHRASLIGFSRGGLYVYLWALAYPDRVTCIYADAPSLDFKSWPGGKGMGGGNPVLWELFKKEFGLHAEEEALAWRGNPLDRADEIARGGYPMLHICGDADMTVPPSENTEPFEQRVRAAGGRITVISKPGVGHHPHSLIDPSPIVDFILKATAERK
jgi:pimeloyl-ACP methyl ester carboxylesterase